MAGDWRGLPWQWRLINATGDKVIILIRGVNSNANDFYLLVVRPQPARRSQRGRVAMASRVWAVISVAIISASPPSWRARI